MYIFAGRIHSEDNGGAPRVLHVSLQVGKISYVLALSEHHNQHSGHIVVYANVESEQATRNDRGFECSIDDGLRQTLKYMDWDGAVEKGHLIIFYGSGEKTWKERVWPKLYYDEGRTIIVWGM